MRPRRRARRVAALCLAASGAWACATRPAPAPVAEAEPAVAPSAPATAAPTNPEPERWAALEAEIRERFPDVPQLSVEDLETWLADPAAAAPVLLDTREPEEFAVSHLPGARLATTTDDALAILSDVPKDAPVVLYCSVGYRSSRMAAELARRGYDDVRNLEGSIFAWANSGRPLASDAGSATAVHPYDEDWGRLLRRELWSPLDGRADADER